MFSTESTCNRCGKTVKSYYFPAKCPVCKAPIPLPTDWLNI